MKFEKVICLTLIILILFNFIGSSPSYAVELNNILTDTNSSNEADKINISVGTTVTFEGKDMNVSPELKALLDIIKEKNLRKIRCKRSCISN